MSARPRAMWGPDLAAALMVLLSALSELGLREHFYRISTEAPGLAALIALMVALPGVAALLVRWCSGETAVRALFVVALAAWVWMVGGQLLPPVLQGGFAVVGLLVIGGVAAMRLSPRRWAALRRALTAATLVFVLSQPLLVAWRAPELAWPPADASTAGAPAEPAALTVVVLLDELSDKASGPIARAMERAGQPVHHQSLLPAGDGTAKVVPALFLGQTFDQAKPCGWSSVCSGSGVLDFGRVHASRPDIDVVGFYIPYCAIAGLRSCEVLSPESPYLDTARWWCAAQRRSEWLARRGGESDRQHCGALGGRVWSELGDRVRQAIWRAPAWTQGGLLYVHMPLPHPPGEGGAGTLGEHYLANVDKAAVLIGEMVDRLAARHRPYRLIVFSDHPLRSSVWCGSTQYRHHGCPLEPALRDEHVPLLVTGSSDAVPATLRGNFEVFRLIAASPR